MTLVNVSEAFLQCEHPFYREVEIQETEVNCVLYSSVTAFNSTIHLPMLNFDKVLHKISLELIRLRSHELQHQQHSIEQQM